MTSHHYPCGRRRCAENTTAAQAKAPCGAGEAERRCFGAEEHLGAAGADSSRSSMELKYLMILDLFSSIYIYIYYIIVFSSTVELCLMIFV